MSLLWKKWTGRTGSQLLSVVWCWVVSSSCLIIRQDVVVRSGVVDLTCQAAGEGQTMSPSQRRVGGRKKKGSNKAVEQNGGDTGNRTLPTARMSFWNVGQSPRVCIDDGRIVLRLSSYSCTMCTKESANRRGSQIWTGAMISIFRHITVSISMTLICVSAARHVIRTTCQTTSKVGTKPLETFSTNSTILRK